MRSSALETAHFCQWERLMWISQAPSPKGAHHLIDTPLRVLAHSHCGMQVLSSVLSQEGLLALHVLSPSAYLTASPCPLGDTLVCPP